MITPLTSVRAVLDRAITGEILDDHQALAEAGIRHADRPAVVRYAQQIAGIAEAGGPTVARRYRDHVIRQETEAAEALDGIINSIQSGDPGSNRRTYDPNHPAIFVLKGVANGRPVPTVQQLTDNGFPTDIARATVAAAEVAAAAVTGAPAGRQIADHLGRQVAFDQPWPAPQDTWSDIARHVPPSTIAADPDYADAVGQVIARTGTLT